MSIGARIQQRLTELGLSRRAASEAAKLNETFIRDVIDGITQSPRIQSLEKLAPVLETTVEWLRTGQGDPNRQEDPATVRVIQFMQSLAAKRRAEVESYAKFQLEQSKRDKSK